MRLNFAAALSHAAARQPDALALSGAAGKLSYRELDDLSDRAASVMRSRGVRGGHRVALALPNVPAFAVGYFAALKVGAVAVPLNPLSTRHELEHILPHCEPSLVIAHDVSVDAVLAAGWAEADLLHSGTPADGAPAHWESALDAAPSTDPSQLTRAEDLAVLLYTSGTTGDPKAVALSHSNLGWSAAGWTKQLRFEPTDRVLAALPFFFSFGLVAQLNTSIFSGASAVLWPGRFEPEAVLDLVEREAVTMVLGVPPMHGAIAQVAEANPERELPHVRMIGSGGANLPLALAEQMHARFGCTVAQGYGLTETAATLTGPLESLETDPRGVGYPTWGVELRTVDVGSGEPTAPQEAGELQARGPTVMIGYYKDPPATDAVISEDGWFRTGDLGLIAENGEVYLLERIKELIIRGGVNVYPSEIEAVMTQHPAIALAAVIGVADERMGEEVCAVVVAHSDVPSEAELIAWLRERLPPQRYPRRIAFVPELPLGPTGKVRKRELDPDRLFVDDTAAR